jgi:hypothetical protein
VNVLRRAWRVYADPATSGAARFAKVLLPIEIVYFTIRLVNDLFDWPPILASLATGTTLEQVLLWYALLWFVRERDEARAELKARDVARH